MPIFLSIHLKSDLTSDDRDLIHTILAQQKRDTWEPSPSATLNVTLRSWDPLKALLRLQQELASQSRSAVMALHVGKGIRLGETYTGPSVEHARYIAESGWPGQVLFSETFVAAHDPLPDSEVKDLGRYKLKDLTPSQHIYQWTHPDLPEREFPPLQTLDRVPHNLHPQSRPFVGRHAEIAKLTTQLQEAGPRLITLKGPGGIGKTRLALRVAAETAIHFSDGVCFLPLASMDASETLSSTIIDTLGFKLWESESAQDQLLGYLQPRTLLLILDNFEHLLPAPPLLMEMLEAAPTLKVLVTSRVALQIPEEQIHTVTGLTYPLKRNGSTQDIPDAVQLFVQSARRVDPLFVLSEKNRAAVYRICRQLMGMPLGVELAAAWIRVFSAAEIADHLTEDMAVLQTNRRDILQRHHSLHRIFEHSWQVLTEEERDIFPQLTVFHGGFRAEAAAFVTGASMEVLTSLHTKSFLSKSSDERFYILQPLRQFAAKELALRTNTWQRLQDQHAAYYLDLAAEHAKDLWTDRQKTALRTLTPEIQNIRAAWRWAAARGQMATVNKAVEFMYRFHRMRGYFREGENLFRSAKEDLAHTLSDNTTPEAQGTLAKLQECAAMFALHLSRLKMAQKGLEESLIVFQKLNLQRYEGFALIGLGMIAYEHGQLNDAKAYFSQSYNLLSRLGNRQASSRALHQLGNVHYASGRYQQALREYHRSMKIHEALRDQLGIANCLYSIGRVESIMANFSEAREAFTQSLNLYQNLRDKQGLAAVQMELGLIDSIKGQFQNAQFHFEIALNLRQELGSPALVAEALIHLTGIFYVLGESKKVGANVHTVLKLRSQYQQPVILGYTSMLFGVFALAGNDLAKGVTHFQEAVAIMSSIGYQRERMHAQGYLILGLILQGRLEKAEKLCREDIDQIDLTGARQFRGYRLTGLGMINVAKQSYAEAKHYFHQAIVEGVEIGMKPAAIDALQNLASQVVARSNPETALAWLTLVMHHPASDVFQKQNAQQAFEQLAEHLPAERVTAARERGGDLTLDEVVTEILSDRRKPCLT